MSKALFGDGQQEHFQGRKLGCVPEGHLQGQLSERHLPERGTPEGHMPEGGFPKVTANEAGGSDNCQSDSCQIPEQNLLAF